MSCWWCLIMSAMLASSQNVTNAPRAVVGQTRSIESKSRELRYKQNFERLRDFISEHGHSDVPRDGSDFSNWFAGVRRAARLGELAPEKKVQLEAAGATFRPLEGRWHEGLRLLKQFVEREGTGVVPKEHVEDGIVLWAWIHRQRREARADRLSVEQRSRLAALGVPGIYASREEADSQRFERNMEALNVFKIREGHVNVPRNHVERHGNFQRPVKLGLWLSTQRAKAHAKTLEAYRYKRLEDAGVRLQPSRAVRVGPSKVHQARKERGKKYWKFLAGAR